jgi:hypothetical protein
MTTVPRLITPVCQQAETASPFVMQGDALQFLVDATLASRRGSCNQQEKHQQSATVNFTQLPNQREKREKLTFVPAARIQIN